MIDEPEATDLTPVPYDPELGRMARALARGGFFPGFGSALIALLSALDQQR